MVAPRKYPDELREHAIRLVLDAKAEPGSVGKNVCRRVGEQLEISGETLRGWVKQADADFVASVGSVGDSYDNAMAEAFNSLFKAELVRNKGPWTGIGDLETAVAEYIDWYTTAVYTASSG